jgi:hypothetical protein
MNGQDVPQVSGVYLIHLPVPYKHAQHYIGYAETSIAERIFEHIATICEPPVRPLGETTWYRYGRGSKFLGVLNYLKITWSLARVWEGQDKTFERRLKNYKKSADFCPLCRGEQAYEHMKG